MKIYRQALLSSLVIFLIASCKKVPDFPKSPEITYEGIKKTVGYEYLGPGANGPLYNKIDSVVISLYFKDGDGDLGTTDTDTTFNNYFCEVLIKKDSTFVYLVDRDSKFSQLNPDGRQGPIEGTLNFSPSLQLDSLFLGYTSPYTLKFKVSILDNAGHRSNEIMTDTVQIQLYD